MSRNIIKIIKYVFAVIGIVLLMAGAMTYNSTRNFIAGASEAQGKVVDLVLERTDNRNSSRSKSSVYKPVVVFTTADNEVINFISSVGSNPPSHSKGEVVNILYNQSKPYEARIDSFLDLWFMTSILTGIGAVFFLIGGGMVLFGMLRQRKNDDLRQTGIRVLANFQRVENASSHRSNRPSSFRIVSQWVNPATSDLHVFKSENLSFDPTDHINSDQITVFIEKNNPKNYYVDTSFLPRLAD